MHMEKSPFWFLRFLFNLKYFFFLSPISNTSEDFFGFQYQEHVDIKNFKWPLFPGGVYFTRLLLVLGFRADTSADGRRAAAAVIKTSIVN